MHIAVIVPAAGLSERFGAGDKLAQDLGGRPVLLRTVEAFTRRDEVRTIVVAGPPDDFDQFRERYGGHLSFHGATLVPGGRADRWETVRLALDAVPTEATHIAVHDAARPAVDDDLLDRLFEAAGVMDAVVPGLPIAETVKRCGDESVSATEDDPIADLILGDAGKESTSGVPVLETVNRAGLYTAQTPQVFAADLLRRAYAQDALDGATDDASLVERLGETVHVVPGDPKNIKITSPDDLDMMRLLLGVRAPKERPAHKRF